MFQPFKRRLKARLNRFARRPDGAVTAFGLFLFMGSAMIGGLALDGMNISRTRTIMQVAADTTAHAAMHYRNWQTESIARDNALKVGLASLPPGEFDGALTKADIEYGRWDDDTDSFIPDTAGMGAARVTVRKTVERGNPMATQLLKLVGRGSFDIIVSAVYKGQIHPCFTQGFVAKGVVDIRSNNVYQEEFCIHSNTHVEFQNNNFFELTTTVSMPDTNDLVLSGSGWSSNTNLEHVLERARFSFGVIDMLPDIITALGQYGSDYMPAYITQAAVIDLDPKKLQKNDFKRGAIHRITCSKTGARVSLPDNLFLRETVVVSNCDFTFGKNSRMRDAIMATTSTNADSFTGSAGVAVGFDDNCTVERGAKLLSLGGMNFPGKLEVYGGQLIAGGDINFSAQGDGIQGASFITGGEISGTSNMVFAYCQTGGVDDPIGLPVPRIAY